MQEYQQCRIISNTGDVLPVIQMAMQAIKLMAVLSWRPSRSLSSSRLRARDTGISTRLLNEFFSTLVRISKAYALNRPGLGSPFPYSCDRQLPYSLTSRNAGRLTKMHEISTRTRWTFWSLDVIFKTQTRNMRSSVASIIPSQRLGFSGDKTNKAMPSDKHCNLINRNWTDCVSAS